MIPEMLNNKVVLKTFIIEDEATQCSQVVMVSIDSSLTSYDLEQFLNSKIPNHQNCSLRIYDFSINRYIPLQKILITDYKVPVTFLIESNSVVLIKYKKNYSETESSLKETFSDSDKKIDRSGSQSLKKQRAKERTICEAIEVVKKWRNFHVQRKGEKKISLQEAAKIVGLSKKSLDDYYYQLRLGQKYGFDFKKNFYQKIGCLRNYLKDKKPHLKSQHSDKHLKGLKVIEQYEDLIMNSTSMKIEKQNFEEVQNKMNLEKEQMIFEDGQCEQMKLQNQFYQDFQFFESQQDPFIGLDGKFKKKIIQWSFDQQFLF